MCVHILARTQRWEIIGPTSTSLGRSGRESDNNAASARTTVVLHAVLQVSCTGSMQAGEKGKGGEEDGGCWDGRSVDRGELSGFGLQSKRVVHKAANAC